MHARAFNILYFLAFHKYSLSSLLPLTLYHFRLLSLTELLYWFLKAQLEQSIVFDYVCFFTDSVEATGSAKNVTVAGGMAQIFTCPVDGNPEPTIEWYDEKTGIKISSGKHLEARESGCYTCTASNSLGISVNISQCLIVGKPDD